MPLREVVASSASALQDIADVIASSRKIVMVTGAGISTACGIPDFRSKDGLYNLIPADNVLPPTPPSSVPSTPTRRHQSLDAKDDYCIISDSLPSSQESTTSRRSSTSPASRMRGQDLFHSRVFQDVQSTAVFYQFIASLRQKTNEIIGTSAAHKFIRTLRDGGRLMRCYTQNIDGLEAREGLSVDLTRGKGNKRRFMKKLYESPRPEHVEGTDFDGGCEVVQLHGELTMLRCTMCAATRIWSEEATQILLQGSAPTCSRCNEKSEQRQATGKRGLSVGVMRPNIVLYGEEHPQNTTLSPLVTYDISSTPDMLIIMGTSLKVHGLQKVIKDLARAVHAKETGRVVFVNRTKPAESIWDSIIDDFVEMDCDEWVHDLKGRRKDIWLKQGELDLNEIKLAKKRKSAAGVSTDVGPLSKRQKSELPKSLSVNIPPRKKCSKKNTTDGKCESAVTKRIPKQPNPAVDDYECSNTNRDMLSPQRPDYSPLSTVQNTPIGLCSLGRTALMTSPGRPNYSPLTSPVQPITPPSLRRPARNLSKLRIAEDRNEPGYAPPVSPIAPTMSPLTSPVKDSAAILMCASQMPQEHSRRCVLQRTVNHTPSSKPKLLFGSSPGSARKKLGSCTTTHRSPLSSSKSVNHSLDIFSAVDEMLSDKTKLDARSMDGNRDENFNLRISPSLVSVPDTRGTSVGEEGSSLQANILYTSFPSIATIDTDHAFEQRQLQLQPQPQTQTRLPAQPQTFMTRIFGSLVS